MTQDLPKNCPFKIGDQVVFNPSKRTLGWNTFIEENGLKQYHAYKIVDINNGKYLTLEGVKGGWHWHDFAGLQRHDPKT